METLVRRLGRLFTRKKNTNRWTPTERTRRQMDRLQEALEAWKAEKAWRRPLRTLTEVAEELGTDTVILHHYFEERVGMDFRTWRTRLRLEDAKQILQERPDLPAAEAGEMAGFSNRSNFSRQFLAYTGSTPLQWRKEARMSRDSRAPENDYV